MTAAFDVLQQWAASDMHSWSGDYSEAMVDLERVSPSTYLFEIHGNKVDYKEKSTFPAYMLRAERYRLFFSDMLEHYKVKDVVFALNVCDDGPPRSDIPVFTFQRMQGSPLPLLPDIELFEKNSFTQGVIPDQVAYYDKSISAVFAGSTTGGGTISMEALRENSIPRIRSARYFAEVEDVCFYLPNIVSCESDIVADAIRAEGYSDRRLSWPEQMTHRFLISIDGHGAACSRVEISLASNSVLVKYTSEFELFYFRGLQNGEHYLSASNDADVIDILRRERENAGLYEAVAVAGRDFAIDYLCNEAILYYTSQLFNFYADSVKQRNGSSRTLGRSMLSSMPTVQFAGTFYMKFLSDICQQREVQNYLEIGVQAGINLAGMKVENAIGVDPGFALTVDPTVGKKSLHLYRQTSDSFFAKERPTDIDLAFLDGMHLFEFLLRDIFNTEAACRRSGLILLHDCLPFTIDMASRIQPYGPWTGDVWKVIPILERYRPDLKIVLIDCEPTGLVALSNLNPASTTLADNYVQIVEEFGAVPNRQSELDKFYAGRRIISAETILSNYSQSLYFRS